MCLDRLTRLDREARGERIEVRVRVDLRAINEEFLAPDQLVLLALLNDGVKEAPKDIDPVAFSDTGQAGMVRKRFVQIVAKIPAHAQPVCRMPHQLAFRANALEK